MKTSYLSLLLILFISFTGFAQSYNSNELNQLINESVDQASSEEIQKGLDALQNAMMNGSKVEVADQYSFQTSVDITLTTFNSKKNTNEMNMRMLFPSEGSYYGIELLEVKDSKGEMPETFMVFDYASLKMVSLMNMSGQKMGFAMALKEDQIEEWMKSENEDEADKSEFTKTGKTKEILGYTCDQYTVSSEDGNGEFWITNDADLQIGLALNAMSQNSKGKKGYDMPEDYPEGAILEMTYADNKGEGMKWLATSIDKNSNRTIQTSDYSFMSFGN